VNYVLFMDRNVAMGATFITYLLTNWTLLSLKYRSSLALVVFVVSPAFRTSNMEGSTHFKLYQGSWTSSTGCMQVQFYIILFVLINCMILQGVGSVVTFLVRKTSLI
jgi:hypothetical protein